MTLRPAPRGSRKDRHRRALGGKVVPVSIRPGRDAASGRSRIGAAGLLIFVARGSLADGDMVAVAPSAGQERMIRVLASGGADLDPSVVPAARLRDTGLPRR